MHILFLSDNFPPETNAPATRVHEHARVWVREGHRVTVITGAPNFPAGRVHAGYRNRWYRRETVDGIEVVRVKTFIAPNRGFTLRILDYLSFMLSAFCAGLLQRRPDVVVGTSPQFFAAAGAWALSAVRRVPFVFELRDLWPASITALGAMRRGPIIWLLERLEMFLYRRAARIVSVTESFRRELIGRGIGGDKIAVVRNGVDLSRYAPRARDRGLARELGVVEPFVVGYVGTHGMAHALHNVVGAADLLQDQRSVGFLLVGDGAERESLVAEAAERELENIHFVPPQPRERMPAIWSLCDLALIHLKDIPLFETVIPSKLFEAMGMGVPALIAAPDGEAAAIVRRAGCGATIGSARPEELARTVLALAARPAERAEMSRRGLAAAREFDRSRLARQMLVELERSMGREPDSETVEPPSIVRPVGQTDSSGDGRPEDTREGLRPAGTTR